MTVYDGVMALIVLYTVVHGYFRGAAWQVAPILSLVLGYMIAMPMSVTMAHYFGPPPLNRLFALVAIYILVSITVYLMVRSFREGVEKAKLTEYDRHLGAILGGVKGVLVTLVATCMLIIYFPQMREVILKSESSSIAAKIISKIYPILPMAMHSILDPYLKKLDEHVPIDLEDSGDGFQGTSGKPAPRSNPSPSTDEFPHLEPTATFPDLPPVRPTARKQMRSTPELLESEDPEPLPQPKPKRSVVRSAQLPEDDPFEAADPDKVSPPQ
jgi:membrane protein required for colicin V production